MFKYKILYAIIFSSLFYGSFAYSLPPVYTENELVIAVTPKNPQFTIKLNSNPTTGYSWSLKEYDKRYFSAIKHQYQSAKTQPKMLGAPGYEYWTFSVKPNAFTLPNKTQLRFVYARPWEHNVQAKQAVFKVTVRNVNNH